MKKLYWAWITMDLGFWLLANAATLPAATMTVPNGNFETDIDKVGLPHLWHLQIGGGAKAVIELDKREACNGQQSIRLEQRQSLGTDGFRRDLLACLFDALFYYL